MDDIFNSDEEGLYYGPKPSEFDTFLPWACQQLQVETYINIIKVFRTEYVSAINSQSERNKGKSKVNIKHLTDNESRAIGEASDSDYQIEQDTSVKVLAYYDTNKNLLEIKFEKNKRVPWAILRIIGLTLPYHPHLKAITINKGLNKSLICELKKLLPFSNITDICLDNTYFTEASYAILLETPSKLKRLSLARCGINDAVCQNIAQKLVYPQPGSLSLSMLNLSTNRITDLGAKYLSYALRSNRKLVYLNLAGNMIGNDGARSILNTLHEFPLASEELFAAKARNFVYLKKRNELIGRLEKELRANYFDKKVTRRRSIKGAFVPPLKKTKELKEPSAKNVQSLMSTEPFWNEKAQAMAENIMGEFDDPFNTNNINERDSLVYCIGNNSLCYLNLAYNNLSYLSVKLLLTVLEEQMRMDRQPAGLINVVIEGNCVPKFCSELLSIDQIIDYRLTILDPKGKKIKPVKS